MKNMQYYTVIFAIKYENSSVVKVKIDTIRIQISLSKYIMRQQIKTRFKSHKFICYFIITANMYFPHLKHSISKFRFLKAYCNAIYCIDIATLFRGNTEYLIFVQHFKIKF